MPQNVTDEFFDFLKSFLDPTSDCNFVQHELFLHSIIRYLSRLNLTTLEDTTDSNILYLRCFIFYSDLLISSKQEFESEKRKLLLFEAKEIYLQFYQILYELKILSSSMWNQISSSNVVPLTREERIQFDKLAITQRKNNKILLDLYVSSVERDDEEFHLDRELLITMLVNEGKISFPKYNSIINELNLLSTCRKVKPLIANSSELRLPFEGKPFIIHSKRQQEQSKVFGASHRLPSMSIEEYLELERNRGGILDSKEKLNNSTDYENVQLYDEFEISKLREFDAFKDENKRGSGNRMNYS